jgi:O-acetyl-ADP-ribose deacetylase (regulator of RNase III)
MIELVQGDITEQRVDAIVNAANSALAHGGGVAAAIARAAGPELTRESAAHPPVEVGTAAVTTAGALPARWVIHAVGPIWRGGGEREPELLDSAYRSALAAAARLGAGSIAFPSISTGIYGYPLESAATVAIAALRAGAGVPGAPETIRLCLFSPGDLAAYERALTAAG